MRPGTTWMFLGALAATAGTGMAGAVPPPAAVKPVAGRASLAKGEAVRSLAWGKDIQVVSAPRGAAFSNAPLAFVGYALQVRGGYDDLAGLDLRGHVAVFASRVPSLPAFKGIPSRDRSLAARIQRLDRAGAIGVILLEAGPLPPGGVKAACGHADLPVLAMPASALVPECGDLAGRLGAIAATGRPQSQDFIYAPWTTLSLDLPGGRGPARRQDPDDRERH